MSDAISVPEIVARSVGKFQLVCPNCGQEYPLYPMDWRHGAFSCTRCHASYQFGLGFNKTKAWDAYLMGKWVYEFCNRWKPEGRGYDGGRLYGSIEWVCRDCRTPQRGLLDYESKLRCERCFSDFYVSLLIYRTSRSSPKKLRVPLDFIVKGLHENPRTEKGILAQKADRELPERPPAVPREEAPEPPGTTQ